MAIIYKSFERSLNKNGNLVFKEMEFFNRAPHMVLVTSGN